MLYVTADTHFGHENIIRYCKRPFPNIRVHDEVLIRNINSIVKTNDTLLHLGDFAFRNHQQYRNQINCQNIVLVVGNHDPLMRDGTPRSELYSLFSKVRQMLRIVHRSRAILCCHYPLASWSNGFMFHGHCHGTLERKTNRFDVGVDCWNYKPISVEELLK